MILINKNSENIRILTLSEKTTIEDAIYLFEVINDESNDVKCFIAEDISINKERYNEFNLIENETEDLLNGTFSLLLKGYYKYNVYEQTSTTNLDPTLATNLIDKGKLLVKDTEIQNPEYSGNQTNYKVYNG